MDKRCKTPAVLQMEALECGAASLGMILAYHGKFVPLEKLRIDCGVSRDGSTAKNIIKAAKKYGLEAKGFKREPEQLKNIELPAIIHWNFNHFLVLDGFGKKKVYIIDPASGPRTISYEEFDQAFTGVVLVFKKSENFELSGKPKSMKGFLFKRIKGAESALVYMVIVSIALVVPGIVVPVFSKVFIDEILLGSKNDLLITLLLVMTIALIIKGILKWLQSEYLQRLETKLTLEASSKFLWHILRLPVEFFVQRFAGDISSRQGSNDKVAALLSRQLAPVVLNIIMIAFYLFLMFRYDWILAVVGCLAGIANILFLKFVAGKRADQNKRLLRDEGKLMGIAIAGVDMIETLKATGSESGFFEKWSGYQAKYMNSRIEFNVSNQYLLGVPVLMKGITDAAVLIFGAWRVLDGQLTMGMLIAFQGFMSGFLSPINEMVTIGSKFQEANGDMMRIDDVMDYKTDTEINLKELHTDFEGYQGGKLSGEIDILNLSFGYNPLDNPLIENFNLKIKPGSRVALVGGSGSGKSTIARIIAGLYGPWTGEVLFDGKTRKQIPRDIINNSIAVVDQDIMLFEGSIKDNISLWDDTLLESDIIQASKDACIHEDILFREDGYSHVVQEGGRNFSGGQRQRIEIARSLALKPTILIMDEATSALDPKTEEYIDRAIRRRGCTCLIVAHRLSTIRDCDEIIVLEKGKVVQRGTHESMKDVPGYYSKLISME